jgi:predicted negative regulator of RcsB-dependent stress response
MKYLLAFVIAIAACGSGDAPKNVTGLPDPGDAIDQDLMLSLAQAKNFHHKAEVYIADGNVPAAIASVRAILSLRFPPNAREAEDVRNDARARLAKLLVGQGQLDEAMRTVEEGLAQSQRQESFFVANLYTVKGEIHEQRAKDLDADAANKAKATDERHAALEAFSKSIEIDKALQKKLMEAR